MVSFIITDHTGNYIRHDKPTNRYVPVRGRQYATQFNPREKACNIRNSLNKELRKTYQVEPIDASTLCYTKYSGIDKDDPPFTKANAVPFVNPVSSQNSGANAAPNSQNEAENTVKLVAQSEICDDFANCNLDDELIGIQNEDREEFINAHDDEPALPDDANESYSVDKWVKKVEEMSSIVDDAQKRYTQLITDISKVDRAITDLHHYAEFKQLDLYKGYLVYRKMHEYLNKRREIKDEILVVKMIASGSVFIPQGAVCVKKTVEGLSRRKYTPRVLKNLFEEGIKP